MVPVINVTVLAFNACLVCAEPNWKIALRLSLTFAGSYSVSSARAEKPQAIMMATSASPKIRRMLSPKQLSSEKNSVRQLSKPALCVGRTELRCLLVPGAGLCRLGNDVADVRGAEHVRIVGLREHQHRAHILRVGGALEQQPGGGKIAGRKEALGALHQRGEL